MLADVLEDRQWPIVGCESVEGCFLEQTPSKGSKGTYCNRCRAPAPICSTWNKESLCHTHYQSSIAEWCYDHHKSCRWLCRCEWCEPLNPTNFRLPGRGNDPPSAATDCGCPVCWPGAQILRDVALCKLAGTSKKGFAAGSTDDPFQPQPRASIQGPPTQFGQTETALSHIVESLTQENEELRQKVEVLERSLALGAHSNDVLSQRVEELEALAETPAMMEERRIHPKDKDPTPYTFGQFLEWYRGDRTIAYHWWQRSIFDQDAAVFDQDAAVFDQDAVVFHQDDASQPAAHDAGQQGA